MLNLAVSYSSSIPYPLVWMLVFRWDKVVNMSSSSLIIKCMYGIYQCSFFPFFPLIDLFLYSLHFKNKTLSYIKYFLWCVWCVFIYSFTSFTNVSQFSIQNDSHKRFLSKGFNILFLSLSFALYCFEYFLFCLILCDCMMMVCVSDVYERVNERVKYLPLVK